MMKKAVSLIVALLICLTMLAGCGGQRSSESKPDPKENTEAVPPVSDPPADFSAAKPEESKEPETDRVDDSPETDPADESPDADLIDDILESMKTDVKDAKDYLNTEWGKTQNIIGNDIAGNKTAITDFYARCEEKTDELYRKMNEKSIQAYKRIAESADMNDYYAWNDLVDRCMETWDESLDGYMEIWDELYTESSDLFDKLLDSSNSFDLYYELSDEYWSAWERMSENYWNTWESMSNDYWAIWEGFSEGKTDVDAILRKAAEERAAEGQEDGDTAAIVPDENETMIPEDEPSAGEEKTKKPALDISSALDSISGLIDAGEESLTEKLKSKLGGLYSMIAGLLSKTSYEEIYTDYSEQIKELTPVLIEDYKSEVSGHSGDIAYQAEKADEKIMELAELANEGVEKMASLYYKKMNYSEYDEWATKLYEVYMDCAGQVYDVYQDSVF